MSVRILLRVSPRQSPSSAILFEMSSDADWPWLAPDFFMFSLLERGSAVARGSAVPAVDGGRLLDPGRQLLLVDLVRLAHIQGAHVLELADGRNWLERGSLEEAELDVVLEGCEGEEPAVPLDSVKSAVPPHGFADAGQLLHDDRVDA